MSKKENANDKMGKWMTGISNMGLASKPEEGCEFCRGEKVIGDAEYNMTICKNDKTNDNYIVFAFNSDHYDDWGEWNNKINYCPMCGRKLREYDDID